jgi:transcriptional regulator with XRE-family HTH domain
MTTAARGHWPAGKPRNPTTGVKTAVAALQRLLTKHRTPGKISARALAAAIGVSDRTVRRWLAGEDVPSPDFVERINEWMAEVKRAE